MKIAINRHYVGSYLIRMFTGDHRLCFFHSFSIQLPLLSSRHNRRHDHFNPFANFLRVLTFTDLREFVLVYSSGKIDLCPSIHPFIHHRKTFLKFSSYLWVLLNIIPVSFKLYFKLIFRKGKWIIQTFSL